MPMALIVQKYGGTSVADAPRIRHVADRVVATRQAGHDVVVVVSAMGDSTDDLIALARRVSTDPPPRELDMLLTAGERISMALLAMAIADRGVTAKSFTGSQAGIITDTLHGKARKLHVVSYEEMLEMAASGARVLMLRCVEYARRYGIPVHVRSSFTQAPGTWVREEDERMEKAIISGVPHDTSEAKVTIIQVPDRPGIAARIMRGIAEHGVNVDMIVQNVSHNGTTDISFTVPKSDLAGAMVVLDKLASEVGAAEVVADSDIAKVSLVGAGMKSSPGVAAGMFEALADAGVNIEMISTSTIRISCVIRSADVTTAVRAIHDRFQLSEEAEFRHEHGEGTAEIPVVRP